MKTILTKLYRFDELSKTAQDYAIEQYREKNEYLGQHWQEDNFESIKAVLKFFDWSITNYSIEYWSAAHSYISISLNLDYAEEIANLSGVRLYKFLNNNYVNRRTGSFNSVFDGKPDNGRCLFTGYCADGSVTEPIEKFLKRPTDITFEELMEKCIYEGLKYIEDDYNHQLSDEYIKEEITDNGLQFNAEGVELDESILTV